MRYWDSSAIVPLLVGERLSDAALACFEADQVVATWWGTSIECVSAIARREREHALTSAEAQQAIARLIVLREEWVEVEASRYVQELAIRLLRVHPLRAADATQLSAALLVRENRGSSLQFVCCDDRLQVAAEKEGLEVEPLIEGSK